MLPRDQFRLSNRLNSIKHDAQFVEYCCKKFHPLPVAPNERAGVWYTNPKLISKTVYFKSTDGHFDNWDFSLKRLNLHILPTIIQQGGCVIIDTTKKGKRFPDSLGKTVPIWCSVLNAVLLNQIELSTSPLAVSESEKDQILKLIPGFIEKLNVN